MKNLKLKTLILAMGISLTGHAQAAGNCTLMLNGLMNWAKIIPFIGNNVVNVTMTTNVNNRKFSSFSNAKLDYRAPFFSGLLFFSESLIGDGTTYFSDRKWGGVNPFNPAQQDKIRIRLTKNALDATKAFVNITLLSWGNAQVNFSAQCDNGHIYGFNTDHHGTHLYDLTFTKNTDSFIIFPPVLTR